jgi:16S rRNA (cytosine967-C5)-methyltransferase
VKAASPARVAAARVLERVETAGAFADVALEREIAERALGTRDAALATELTYGTIRWQRYLDWRVAPHSRRPFGTLDPRVRVVLRLAAYQLVFLERVPAFAAVNDAVTLARHGSKPGVPEFVNAVLRSFARGGVREREPALPADAMEALATRWSFPTWLATRWVERFGADEATDLMRALNERPPTTLRVNTLRTTRQALTARLAAEEQLAARPTRWAEEGVNVEHGGAPASWRSFGDGAFAIQDEASMLVTRLLEPRAGDTIADVCAAPGTKSTHLAQLMDNRGRIVAFDRDPARLARAREASARLGTTIVETMEGTVEERAPAWSGACDAVLVDAPCTNLGVLRRNPEVKWRRLLRDIPDAARRQGQILAAAAGMVRPGGRLVYATCSLEPEENEEVLAVFLAAHPDFTREAPVNFPVALDARGILRCLPHRHGTDGFTAARLRRAS